MDSITCSCVQCGARFTVAPSAAGLKVACPKCGRATTAPEAGEEEAGTYGVAGEKTVAPGPSDSPGAALWPDGSALKLPPAVRTALDSAREYAEAGKWRKAARELAEAYRNANERVENALRRPFSYCLAKLAARELEKLNESGDKPSGPFRRVLKTAAELQKWGGSFDRHACPGCERRLASVEGCLKIRTAAGPAYLCCSGPTEDDADLVQEVDAIWQLLALARRLNPDDADASAVLTELPWWYRALLTREYEAGWITRVSAEEEFGDEVAALLADGAADGLFRRLTR